MQRINWEQHISYILPKDSSAKKRDTEWICVCYNCQNERVISYCQAFNIVKGKATRTCLNCNLELGLTSVRTGENLLKYSLDKDFQKQVSKARIGIKREKSRQVIKYAYLFSPEKFNTKEAKIKQSLAKKGKYGPLASRWEGGKTNERRLLMRRQDYRLLRTSILVRDNYTCQLCNTHGGILEMDHVKEWCNYPELRYEPSNLRILCKPCHKTTDNYGYKAKRKLVK